MKFQGLRPWFRLRVEEQLLTALAIPLYLVQPVSQVIETLINEARKLGFSHLNELLMIRTTVIMREQVTRVVRGGLASMIETMLNAERLGIDPGVSVLYVLRELDDHLRTMGSDYRDLVILLDILIILTLAMTPMVIVIMSQALNMNPAPYLIINYATAAPIALALSWNLDPGLLSLDGKVLRNLPISVVPAVPAYVLTHSIAIAWLTMALTFLALTARWYVDYLTNLSTLGRRAVEAVIRASTMPRAQWIQHRRNWLEGFINEYARTIALTGMGRSDVLTVAVTAITHTINTLMDSRRVSALSILVSTSFIITLLVVFKFVISQVAVITIPITLLLPTTILGSFFSGYLLDSFVTGIYASIPTVMTYVIVTMH
jgi:hypothetical protein